MRAEIGQILRTHTQTTAAKLVVRILIGDHIDILIKVNEFYKIYKRSIAKASLAFTNNKAYKNVNKIGFSEIGGGGMHQVRPLESTTDSPYRNEDTST